MALWGEAIDFPIFTAGLAPPLEAIMEPIRAVTPEFYFAGVDTEPTPMGRSRRRIAESFSIVCDPIKELLAGGKRFRLPGRPGPKATAQGSRGEIRVGDIAIFTRYRAAHPQLPAQGFPVHHECGIACRLELDGLGARIVGEEHERV